MNKHQGRHVLRALEDKGLSFAEIARRCDVSRPHVSQVVHGKRDSRRIRSAIIEALGFDPWLQPKKEVA